MVSVSFLSPTSSGGFSKRMSNMKVIPSCQVSHQRCSNGSTSTEEIISVFRSFWWYRFYLRISLSLILDDTGYTSVISEKENLSHSGSRSSERKVSRRHKEPTKFEHICSQSLFSRDENWAIGKFGIFVKHMQPAITQLQLNKSNSPNNCSYRCHLYESGFKIIGLVPEENECWLIFSVCFYFDNKKTPSPVKITTIRVFLLVLLLFDADERNRCLI